MIAIWLPKMAKLSESLVAKWRDVTVNTLAALYELASTSAQGRRSPSERRVKSAKPVRWPRPLIYLKPDCLGPTACSNFAR